MKKLAMLAILCAPLMLSAQTKTRPDAKTKTKTTQTDSKSKEGATKDPSPKVKLDPEDKALRFNNNIYIEVTVTNQGSGLLVKLDLAQYATICTDKELKVGLEKARAKRYSSLAFMMNDLDQLGFSIVSSFQTAGRGGAPETHLVLSAPNRAPQTNVPVRGVGNTMSKENPGFNTKEKK